MEETTSTNTPSKGGSNKFIMPVAIVVIIAIAAIGYYAFQSQKKASTTAETTPAVQQEEVVAEESATQYKDGTYQVVGEYVSPGGPREVDVTVTLAGDVITDATFVGKATDAPSMRFQGEFKEGFEPMVVGKNINEVNLTKVSGSSLTPKGFMDAIEKIKAEAQG